MYKWYKRSPNNTAGKKSSSDEKLDRIREKIKNGEYESDTILNAITDELLKIVWLENFFFKYPLLLR